MKQGFIRLRFCEPSPRPCPVNFMTTCAIQNYVDAVHEGCVDYKKVVLTTMKLTMILLYFLLLLYESHFCL